MPPMIATAFILGDALGLGSGKKNDANPSNKLIKKLKKKRIFKQIFIKKFFL
jgi:hypothetical protein